MIHCCAQARWEIYAEFDLMPSMLIDTIVMVLFCPEVVVVIGPSLKKTGLGRLLVPPAAH